jgi:hypothetical protein
MVQYYFDEYYYPGNSQYCKKHIKLIFYFCDICYFSTIYTIIFGGGWTRFGLVVIICLIPCHVSLHYFCYLY